ncbi:acetoacetate--CoA ligase [Halomonas sp. McH1-25]|uniref:acetoacetate--CoA ligase n=1 Tax=unclassified Halomonas TaxID=2609666 RepID=UPI001EF74E8F|nr:MULTISPECIES: acetoacetate--CoA ligase [unclassified Halomonas]MCG7598535.1 acetoacetate--CoA ligase [Halomonas sp. McH1-25]MCP1341787.1 acetoacetate--CoA ligase [Halomonas sp. FL8]MCP1361004.1 acetoacetate--CoA ligase [Halomonas sp. BBD45]
MSQPLWQPSQSEIEATQMHALMQRINREHDAELSDYASLHAWSVDNLETFWRLVWEESGVLADTQGDTLLERPDAMPGARWFPHAKLNFAANLLRRRDDHPALIACDERGRRQQISFAELYDQVAKLAHALRASGITAGDRVAGFVPNSEHAVIAMLATASLGAVWSSCSPDFGFNGVLDRFGQIQPKVLIATDGYTWNGKPIDTHDRIAKISGAIESLNQVVIFPFLHDEAHTHGIDKAVAWHDYLNNNASEIEFEPQPFDHPLYILYSSGTTGAPKCIVHSAGGTLLQHLKEHRLHTDLRSHDVLFYYTTCGWMMWNWLVSGLASGSTLVLFDGSPFAPTPDVLWSLAEREGISVFGTSAKYIAACEKEGLKPGRSHDLSRLRAVLSTGSALAHESFDYVYRDIGPNLLLASISGGTDIVSCFALGCPIRPVYRGQLQCRGLGMAVDVFDDDGKSLREAKGELVCTRPFPSMPIGFWNDPDGERYREAYFSTFPGIWAHGDYAEITAEDGLIIHGRSDAVLNPGGVRIGTAEIYRQVEKVEGVLESLCIGQEWGDDIRVILFVRLQPGIELDEALRDEIRRTIRINTSPRHVPAKIIQVSDIPRTLSGKIVELAVRNIVHGRPVKNQDALANPEALKLYENLTELHQ